VTEERIRRYGKKEEWKEVRKKRTQREILKRERTRKRRWVSSVKFRVLQSEYPTKSLAEFSATRDSILTNGYPE